jgi:hypothetical protein
MTFFYDEMKSAETAIEIRCAGRAFGDFSTLRRLKNGHR